MLSLKAQRKKLEDQSKLVSLHDLPSATLTLAVSCSNPIRPVITVCHVRKLLLRASMSVSGDVIQGHTAVTRMT